MWGGKSVISLLVSIWVCFLQFRHFCFLYKCPLGILSNFIIACFLGGENAKKARSPVKLPSLKHTLRKEGCWKPSHDRVFWWSIEHPWVSICTRLEANSNICICILCLKYEIRSSGWRVQFLFLGFILHKINVVSNNFS